MRYLRSCALCALAIIAINLVSIGPAAASSDPLQDVLDCAVVAGRPGVSNYEVTGYGGTTPACATDPAYFGSEVCLDYNGVTVATSCVTYGPGEAGPTNPVSCLPGVWATQVTPIGAFGPLQSSVHSQLLIVLPTQAGCINPH